MGCIYVQDIINAPLGKILLIWKTSSYALHWQLFGKKNTLQLSFFHTQSEKVREEAHVKKDKWKKRE